jgi:hypothetical protein
MFLKSQTTHQSGLGTQPPPDELCGWIGLSSRAILWCGRFRRSRTKCAEFLPWITGFFDKILRALVMLHNPAHCNPRRRYKHPWVTFLFPSTYKVGAIRVSFQKRAVLRIGNKACRFLVFIVKETSSGVWRNKPADFLDMKLVQDVSHSWCDRFGQSPCP